MTPLPLILYRWVTRAIEPLAPRLLDARVRKGKEDPDRVDERLGQTRAVRPEGDLVWLHGASVGETLSLLPVVERLRKRRPDLGLLVTSGTVTSAELMARRLPEGVIHQYVPVDGPGVVAAFLDHWKPSLALFVESELWPNLLLEAKRRGVRLALVSARITAHSSRGWGRWPRAARALFETFDRILPQDEASAERIRALGGRVDGLVNLKLVGEPLPHDPAQFTALSAAVGDRAVVVAASTHAGEEIAIVRALDRLGDRLFLILVPRHPERREEIAQALRRDGYDFALRSTGAPPDRKADLYLADTLGEMGLFLRLADVVVMGGAFAPDVGGHNPLEPARLGKPTVTGPDMANWAAITDYLVEAGALIQVKTPGDLAGAIGPLLADPDEARAMGQRALKATQGSGGDALDQLFETLEPLLPSAPVKGRRA